MTDWRKLAEARGVPLNEEETAAVETVLAALEDAFTTAKSALTAGVLPDNPNQDPGQ